MALPPTATSTVPLRKLLLVMLPVAVLRMARLSGSLSGSGKMATTPLVDELPVSATMPALVGLRMAPVDCTWLFAITPPPGPQAIAAWLRACTEVVSSPRLSRSGAEPPASGPVSAFGLSGGAVCVLEFTAMPRPVTAPPRLLAVADAVGLVPPFMVDSLTASLTAANSGRS